MSMEWDLRAYLGGISTLTTDEKQLSFNKLSEEGYGDATKKDLLPECTSDDLKEMGITSQATRKALLKAFRSGQAEPSASGAAEGTRVDQKTYRIVKALRKDFVFMMYPIPASQRSSEYRPAAIAAYAHPNDPGGQLRCLVTGRLYPASDVKAAHIYQRQWKQAPLVKAKIDLDGPDNVVLMHKTVEKRFDALRFCIIPVAPDTFQIKALDTKLLTDAQQGWVTSAADNLQGPALTWKMLDGNFLNFHTNWRPSALCFAAHARRAVIEAEANEWINKGEVTVPRPTWHGVDNIILQRFFADLDSSSSAEQTASSKHEGAEQEASEHVTEPISASVSQELPEA